MKYGWSKVVGCQNMSAPKCAPYVQRHDADLITRSSPTVPVDTFSGYDGHGVLRPGPTTMQPRRTGFLQLDCRCGPGFE